MKFRTQVMDANVGLQSKRFVKRLRHLTLGPGSGMNDALDALLEIIKDGGTVDAYFILAYHPDHDELIAWAVLSEESFGTTYNIQGRFVSFTKGDGSIFEVYVAPQYRRHGIGSHLLKIAKKIAFNEIFVVPWDEVSCAFYSQSVLDREISDLREKTL